ncbi:hypothetical protein TCON_1141 [Astathelohania contejeani]|uniref:Uncharacterized protein n=1 Tax=Astathelohania contejeani TaxID=164912 RepID=A0ABQ7HZN8_9MICR|nr:hypothetical protein TCON_1141 [Thelohania contejeani]
MNENNKQLALKNSQLKREINQLTLANNELIKENIKEIYFHNRSHKKMIDLMNENIKGLEDLIKKSQETKTEIEKINKEKGAKYNKEDIDKEFAKTNVLKDSSNQSVDSKKIQENKRKKRKCGLNYK